MKLQTKITVARKRLLGCKLILLTVLLALSLVCGNTFAQTLLWYDEFDGESLDLIKWEIFDEPDSQDPDGWYRPENVEVSDGTLKIYNKEELHESRHWTGGHIDALHYPQYKYLEARVRHSAPDTHIWATWWTVGWTGSTWVWPPEMDICEILGGPGKIPGQTYWYNYDGSGNRNDGTVNTGMDESQWHTYGVYWDATTAPIFYVDGVISGAPVSPCEGNLMAAKLKLTSSPNAQDRYSGCPLGTMEVDYVRVYDAPPAQPPASPGNLASHKPADASSTKNSGGAAKRAVDDSTVTRWESEFSDPQWLRVDLEDTYTIDKVKIYWQYACASEYKIQVADNLDDQWTDCIHITGNSTHDSWLTHEFSPQTGRYIRVLCIQRATEWGYSIWEMEFYGGDSLPALIEAEDYTSMSGVATESCSEGGLNVGWISTGDWMEYAGWNIPGGSYTVEYRVASHGSGGQLRLDLDGGATQFTSLTVPSTGGWQNWTSIFQTVNLPSGTHDIRIYAPMGGWNINWFEFTSTGGNLALNKTTTASSFQECFAWRPQYVIDGDTGTRWSSDFSDPQWIYMDLGGTHSINQVKLLWEAACGKEYKIQVASSIEGPWTDCIHITDNTTPWRTHDFSAQSGRYVRMYGIQRATTYGYSIWEMEVYGGGSKLALSNVTASSQEGCYQTPRYANDGHDGTRWSSDFSDPQWIYVDLEATHSINQVKLLWETACGKEYKIQVASYPYGPWTDCAHITDNTTSGTWLTHNFSPQNGRYVRMYGIQRATGYGYSLWEMEVYGD